MYTTTTKNIYLDFYNNNIVVAHAKQNDVFARYLNVTCTDHGQRVKLRPDDMLAFIRYKRSDNESCFDIVKIREDDGTIDIDLTPMLVVPGRQKIDLIITIANGKKVDSLSDIKNPYDANVTIISTMKFELVTISSPINDSEITDSINFTPLNNTLAKLAATEKDYFDKMVEMDTAMSDLDKQFSNLSTEINDEVDNAIVSIDEKVTQATMDKQADWNINDSFTLPYIKNRTHYVDADGVVHKLDPKYLAEDGLDGQTLVRTENGMKWGWARPYLYEDRESDTARIGISFNEQVYNEEYRFLYDQGIKSLELYNADLAGTTLNQYHKIKIVFFTQIYTPLELILGIAVHFVGDHCTGGIFNPRKGYLYELNLHWNGIKWVCNVLAIQYIKEITFATYDVNGDGMVDLTDLDIINNIRYYTDEKIIARADVNKDGVVDDLDQQAVRNYMKQLEYGIHDINQDGDVDVYDLQIIHNHLFGQEKITDQDMYAIADFNNDGLIDTSDAQLIFNYLDAIKKYDINRDGKVDLEDFNIIKNHIDASKPITDELIFERADLNQDGIVDENDLNELKLYFDLLNIQYNE